jgi:hypothetical protein
MDESSSHLCPCFPNIDAICEALFRPAWKRKKTSSTKASGLAVAYLQVIVDLGNQIQVHASHSSKPFPTKPSYAASMTIKSTNMTILALLSPLSFRSTKLFPWINMAFAPNTKASCPSQCLLPLPNGPVHFLCHRDSSTPDSFLVPIPIPSNLLQAPILPDVRIPDENSHEDYTLFYSARGNVPNTYSYPNQSFEEIPTPDFADIDNLLASLLILKRDDPVIPSHDHSLLTTPSFEIPIEIAAGIAVGSLSTHPPG